MSLFAHEKNKKRVLRITAACLALSFGIGLCGCAPNTPPVVQEGIVIGSEEKLPTVYSAQTKTEAVEKINGMVEALKAELLGSAGKRNEALVAVLRQGVEACQNRGLSVEELQTLVDTVCAQKELFKSLILQDETNGESANALLQPAMALFGELSSALGAEDAAKLFFDFAKCYCEYEYQHNLSQYQYSKLTIYLTQSKAWKDRKAGLEGLGEDNFDCLLRVAVSGGTLFSANVLPDSLSGLVSAGEAALFLRAQGEMLSRLRLTEENWSFVIKALGDSGYSPSCAAITAAKAHERYAAKANGLLQAVVLGLLRSSSESARGLLEGKPFAYLYSVSSSWGEREWEAFDEFCSVETDEGAYLQYFEKQNKKEAYEAFKEGFVPATLSELRAASEAEFPALLEGYLSATCPALAFTVFGV